MGSRLGAMLRGRFVLWWLMGWIPILLGLVVLPVAVWLACFAEPWWWNNGFLATAWLVLRSQLVHAWFPSLLVSGWLLGLLLAVICYVSLVAEMADTLIRPVAAIGRRLGWYTFTVWRDPRWHHEQLAWAEENAHGFWLYGDGLILFASATDAVYYKLRWVG